MSTASTSRLDQVWDEARRRIAELAADTFAISNRAFVAKGQSPIEELFLIALACEADPYSVEISPQRVIGPYRVDVLIEWRDPAFPADAPVGEAIVELDGHTFHERTKHQAKADKSRDRWLTNQNYRVIRFTGSEVYADPFKCANEAIEVASTAFYDMQGVRTR